MYIEIVGNEFIINKFENFITLANEISIIHLNIQPRETIYKDEFLIFEFKTSFQILQKNILLYDLYEFKTNK